MKHIRNVYSSEWGRVNLDQEIATGTDGFLFKGGQGELADFPRIYPDYIKRIEDKGLPWGITWQCDARYSPERHKAGIKQWYPTGNFGKLGLWLCVEYPYYPIPFERLYWLFPFANYKNYESIWRGVFNYTGIYPGIYTSISKWNLIFGSYTNPDPKKCPRALQEEIARESDLMVAQYGVSQPDVFGAWMGHWAVWQHRENPDYSVCDDEWFNKRVGLVIPPPVEPPVDELMESITIRVRSDGRAKLLSVIGNGHIDLTDVSLLETEPFPIDPVPEPQPEPEVVVDDIQYGVLKFQVIGNELQRMGRYTPAVVQLQDVAKPNSGKGASIPVHQSAWDFMRKINDDRGWNYCKSIGAMWINTPYTDPLNARGESIDCMCNVISWYKNDVKNGCYHIRCFQSVEDFQRFDPAKVNWHMRPELFIKAQSVNLDGSKWIKVRDGVDCYIPLMARAVRDGGTGNLWLAMSEVEPYPSLPCKVKVAKTDGLYVRQLPDTESAIIRAYSYEEEITLLEYAPLGAWIWGRTKLGWVCLRNNYGEFLTSWVLETPRILPPE